MRGSRVKNIVRELNNEKVDIIRWSSDPKETCLGSAQTGEGKKSRVRYGKKSVQISVDEDQLSLAIGKKGQNARLTSRLTGWEINIGKDTSATTVPSNRKSRKRRKPSPARSHHARNRHCAGEIRVYQSRRIDVMLYVAGPVGYPVRGDEAKAREIHEAVHGQEVGTLNMAPFEDA